MYQCNLADQSYDNEVFRSGSNGAPVPCAKALSTMSIPNNISGAAALSICESLLLALNDHKILPEAEIVAVLRDAAAAHENAPTGNRDELNEAVAALINSILVGNNSVRRR